jgi:N-dimethylarginine dimethylaminohydrolase
MDRFRQVDHELAARQWTQLRRLLESRGAVVSLMAPIRGLPDLVFTANAALIYRGLAVPARFRHAQRQQEVGELLGCEVIPLELVDPRYYHLDTCFCPLAPGVAIYYPPAFDGYARAALQAHVDDLIPVSDEEAGQFACNAVVLGTTVITNSGCPDLHRQLRERGLVAEECPLSEFVKAGGSAKCLTLRLDGEEAAVWRLTECLPRCSRQPSPRLPNAAASQRGD